MGKIEKVTLVSDGIVVEFDDSTICYFPAKNLREHISDLGGQIFLNHDPSLSFGLEPNPGADEKTRDERKDALGRPALITH